MLSSRTQRISSSSGTGGGGGAAWGHAQCALYIILRLHPGTYLLPGSLLFYGIFILAAV